MSYTIYIYKRHVSESLSNTVSVIIKKNLILKKLAFKYCIGNNNNKKLTLKKLD